MSNSDDINDEYGFIITRYVNSDTTNDYWNQCIRCLRKFYPRRKIVVIDDNSNYNFVKADYEYKNVEIVQSEFAKRGEFLPYYYYYHRKWFKNAVIIHDSIFIHKRIPFEKFSKVKVLPLWHFEADNENVNNSLRLISNFNHSHVLQRKLLLSDTFMQNHNKWYGCFGVQSYINHDFLVHIFNKYNMFSLIHKVNNRPDRCCLERIFGIIFTLESPFTRKMKSMFGSIQLYINNFSYSFENYKYDLLVKKKLPHYIIKVWSGR
jgi:hypothetical protein